MGNFFFFFPLKFHPFVTMRKIKNTLRRICFFCFISFYHFFPFFFIYLKLIFGSVRSIFNKRNKKFKIEGHKVQTPDTVARLDIFFLIFLEIIETVWF